MNLSPQRTKVFNDGGYEAMHWSEIGRVDATDFEILDWARKNDFVIFTHDLDFGAILSTSKLLSPEGAG